MDTKRTQETLRVVKRACDMCSRNKNLPKASPAEHIISNHFGERILVDCKTVFGKGFIVIAVDHFTTFIWTMFVTSKHAVPIAEFVTRVMESKDRIREERSSSRSKPTSTEDELRYTKDTVRNQSYCALLHILGCTVHTNSRF